MALSLNELSKEYFSVARNGLNFCHSLEIEIEKLLSSKSIILGVPIESRLKEWDSIAEKIENKSLELNSILDLSDLVGLRLILLFKRDVDKACELIAQNFKVLEIENPEQKLGEDQFGYLSHHYQVSLLDEWQKVPSFKGFGDFHAEIQIRTLAQHIWAQASHILQYKHEAGVPLPVKRSINRVSALLETVDLEFERVLDERETYVSDVNLTTESSPLNVDLLEKLLNENLPEKNKDRRDEEGYAELLSDLIAFDIDKSDQLQKLIEDNLEAAIKEDAERVLKIIDGAGVGDPERAKLGVFYTHVGLIRMIMRIVYGERWEKYRAPLRKKFSA